MTINSLSDDALRLSAPDPLKLMDEDFKASARKLKEFVDLAITGIDDFDTNALLQAQDAMVEAGTPSLLGSRKAREDLRLDGAGRIGGQPIPGQTKKPRLTAGPSRVNPGT